MNSKLVFQIVKNQLKKQIEENNPELIILVIDFITGQNILQVDNGDKYTIESPGFNNDQLKLLIADKLDGETPRRLLLSFYYKEKTRDYFTIAFESGKTKSYNLYKNG